MRILFIGDICGKPGLLAINKYLKRLIAKLNVDIVVANGENASPNMCGVSLEYYKTLLANGITILTGGNHSFDNNDIYEIFKGKRVLRPYNYVGDEGIGSCALDIKGNSIAIINLCGSSVIQPVVSPFDVIDGILSRIPSTTKNIIIDFHAEFQKEKILMAKYLNGKVSAILGTHMHVPSLDGQISNRGTFYITDVGMTGDCSEPVGLNNEEALFKIYKNICLKPELQEETLCGVFLETDSTGKVLNYQQIIIGDRYANTINA